MADTARILDSEDIQKPHDKDESSVDKSEDSEDSADSADSEDSEKEAEEPKKRPAEGEPEEAEHGGTAGRKKLKMLIEKHQHDYTAVTHGLALALETLTKDNAAILAGFLAVIDKEDAPKKIETLQQEDAALQAQFTAVQQENAALKAQLTALQQEKAELQTRFDELQKEYVVVKGNWDSVISITQPKK